MVLNPLRQNIHKGRLLVIDADPVVLLTVETSMVLHGYQVVVSDSWSEARQHLQQGHFDLILSDLQAGQGSGEGTVKTLLALGGVTEVLVGIEPANLTEGRAALQHGATAYLLQPYDAGELQTLIDRSLYRHEEAESQRRLAQEISELRGSHDVFVNCLPLLQVEDLDRLGEMVLDTLMELCGAEAGVLWLAGGGCSDLRLHSQRGLSPLGSISGDTLPPTTEAAALSADRRTLSVPLRCRDRMIGLARLESPVGRESFGDDELLRIGHAIAFAAVTLSALLRRQEVEYNLLRAPESQAYNMTFFRDHLEKGLYAAKRYDRKLTLIKVVIDNYGELSSRFLDRQLKESVEKIVATIMTVLRDADLICTILPGQFYVLLPETDSWGR